MAEETLSLLTWNCFGAAQGLVAWLRWRGIPEGHRLGHDAVHATLGAADVVCLQEVFLGEAEDLFARLAHPFKARDHNRTVWSPLSFGGSGLALASRHEVRASASRAFAGPNVGVERFARKGMLHALIDTGAAHVDVITTHMQSGYGAAAADVRARQMDQLREWAEDLGARERTMVVCGDFNVDGRTEARARKYETLRRLFDGFEDLGARADATTFHPHPDHNPLAHRYDPGAPEQRIDYVLLRPAAGARATSVERVLDRPLDGRASPPTHPSDHYGLRVTIAP